MRPMKAALPTIRLGISACLMGRPTRYDGGHRLDVLLRDAFGGRFEFFPLCPEAEAGFGVPREPMRLEGDPQRPRLMTRRTRRDLTEAMESWARSRVVELEKEKLAGFIFKARSPCCGVHGCGAVGTQNFPSESIVSPSCAAGLFARAFMEHFPRVPVEEDERLHDDAIREAFIKKACAAYKRRHG